MEPDPMLDVEARLGELRPGRLFIHGRLSDAHTGGPLYCRLQGWEEADRRIVFAMLHSHLGGRESRDMWRPAVETFFESHLGRWYDEGDQPPPPPPGRRKGLRPPLPPKKAGSSGPGGH